MAWLTAFLKRPPVGWWDVADILVVSVLIYEVLKLIRGTRAVQMALGGGFLMALFYGSRWGHLETANWLIRNMVGYMVFAAIVLFQADIRRALAHLGRAPFFRYFAKAESEEESIEELVIATSMMSSQRVGAIIALERQIGLRNYIEGGIPLDAVLTYDLLLSIFQRSSPLHDGAVVVQEDRIAAAACFLPLTVNPKMSTKLGSRHRAAIGLTEENDAVAIVVSEETGGISIASEGQIERGVKRIWPFEHFGLKALSVCVAVLLWMAVAGEETVERGLRVPLELQQFPAGLELQGEVPTTVDVRVRGTSGTLGRVLTGDIVAVLDLRGARAGRRLFQLNPELVRAPFGVEVVQVAPATVAMVFESSASRQVPVVPAVDGKPAPGYVVGPTTADPESVEVVGPESAVKRATEALTEPISIAGARDPARGRVARPSAKVLRADVHERAAAQAHRAVPRLRHGRVGPMKQPA